MSAEEIIQEAQSLPPDQRARIVDTLLRSLRAPDPAIERQWAALAKVLLAEYRAGNAETVTFDEFLSTLKHRFSGA